MFRCSFCQKSADEVRKLIVVEPSSSSLRVMTRSSNAVSLGPAPGPHRSLAEGRDPRPSLPLSGECKYQLWPITESE